MRGRSALLVILWRNQLARPVRIHAPSDAPARRGAHSSAGVPASGSSETHLNGVVETPVLIVGAGPVGVYLSALLSRFGVESTVVDKRPASSMPGGSEGKGGEYSHPRAHVLHARTMELMREIGLEEKVLAAMPPIDMWKYFRYGTALLGQEIVAIDHCDDADGAAR
ncbi:FAD binding domain-containing protein, partial [Baffinella frigidus]